MARVTHFEIHAQEPERAIDFYSTTLGWSFMKWPGGDEEYWLVTTGPDDEPGINGGMIRRKGDVDGAAVIAYVCTCQVESADDALRSIEMNGGEIVVPMREIPGVGRHFYAKDTEGNIFGCMEPASGSG